MAIDDFLPNGHSRGAVIRTLGLAPGDWLAGGDAAESLASPLVGTGLRVGLAIVRPAETPNRHLASSNLVLNSAFGPELGNNHVSLPDMKINRSRTLRESGARLTVVPRGSAGRAGEGAKGRAKCRMLWKARVARLAAGLRWWCRGTTTTSPASCSRGRSRHFAPAVWRMMRSTWRWCPEHGRSHSWR